MRLTCWNAVWIVSNFLNNLLCHRPKKTLVKNFTMRQLPLHFFWMWAEWGIFFRLKIFCGTAAFRRSD